MPKLNEKQKDVLLLNNMFLSSALTQMQVETMKRLTAKGLLAQMDVSGIFDAIRLEMFKSLPDEPEMKQFREAQLERLDQYERDVLLAVPRP